MSPEKEEAGLVAQYIASGRYEETKWGCKRQAAECLELVLDGGKSTWMSAKCEDLKEVLDGKNEVVLRGHRDLIKKEWDELLSVVGYADGRIVDHVGGELRLRTSSPILYQYEGNDRNLYQRHVGIGQSIYTFRIVEGVPFADYHNIQNATEDPVRLVITHLERKVDLENVYFLDDGIEGISISTQVGIRHVGVATGYKIGYEKLSAAKPYHVLENLSDTQKVLRILGLE